MMTVTAAYTEVIDNFNVVGCGWYMQDSNTYHASIYRVGNDGTFKWFYLLSSQTTNTTSINKCYGIAYDNSTQRITTLIQTTSTYLSYGVNYDLALVIFDKSGTIYDGQRITFKYDIQFDSVYFNNFMFMQGKYFVFGGYANGFTTQF